MNNFIKKAVQAVVGNLVATKNGLLLPAPLIAGKHFGGFQGYEPWIQQCIAAACTAVRGVQPDELSELTALCMWEAEDQSPILVVERHAKIVQVLDDYGGRLVEAGLAEDGVTGRAVEQVRRADGTRELGTILVVATRWVNGERYKELKLSVSAWNPATVEEAQAMPRQKYLLG